MELKQLQTIKNILNEGSYLKAAEKMGYVPSTVTLHIQQLDIAIGFAPPSNLNLYFEPICLEPMDLLLPVGHPLANKKEITLKDLSNVNLLLTESYCSYRNEVDKHFSAFGIPLKTMIQINDGKTIIQFVQAGIGCSILPVAAIDPVPDLTVRRKLSNIEFGLMIGVIRRKEQLEKASERLYNELVYELKNMEHQRS